MKEYIERAAILKSLGYDEKRRADVLPGSTFDIVLKEPTADMVEGDTRDMEYTRAKFEERLRMGVGPYYIPREERYQ